MVETQNKIEELLSTNHPDVDYLRQADISLVLSKALAETFKAQPLEPRKYFAKYLLNYAEQKRREGQVSKIREKVLNRFNLHQIQIQREEKKEVIAVKKVDHEKQL